MKTHNPKSLTALRLAATTALMAIAGPGALAAESVISASFGADYSVGKYGRSERTETRYFPMMLKAESGPMTYKLTIPYVEVRGPADVVGAGDDTVVLGAARPTRTAAGLGDVVAAASGEIWADYESSWAVELGGKIKFATADESKGLGTGRNDYSLFADVYKTYGMHSLFATLGKRKMGDPAGVDYRDPWFGSLGWSRRLSDKTSAGLMVDLRQRLQAGGDPAQELTGFVSHKLDGGWKLQGYVVTGFTRSSPDLGLGATLGYNF